MGIFLSSYSSPHIPLLIFLSSYSSPHVPLLMFLSLYSSPHIPLLIFLSLYSSPYIPLLIPPDNNLGVSKIKQKGIKSTSSCLTSTNRPKIGSNFRRFSPAHF